MRSQVMRLLDAIPRPWGPGTFAYVLRSIAAAGLALWLGLQLQLDSPFSGASTVLLLVHPIQGAVVGKGFNRVLGTLVGMLAAFVLTGLFAQQMLLYILGIGVWLGLCVGAMTVLRHYQATAAVVAGYTVCLALGPAIVAPEQGFDHIVTRGTAVVLGVFSLSLAATLFSNKTVERKVRAALVEVCARSARLLAVYSACDPRVELPGQRRQLAIDIGKVDDLLGIGRGESSLIRRRLLAIQAGLAHLQSAILEVHLADADSEVRSALSAELARIGTTLGALGGDIAGATCDFATAAARVGHMRSELEHCMAEPGNPRSRLFTERLDERLAELADALLSFSSLDQRTNGPVRAVGFHRHYADAVRNGIRALLATLLAGGVWYVSGWDQGPTLLAVLGPYCTLLATAPAPEKGIAGFIRGTLYAALAAAVCKFLLMPQINGFPLLLMALAVFWSFGIHATSQPRHALQGIAYLIAFNTLVSTGGTAQYDFVDFANQTLAWIVALIICLLAFQILPKNADHQVRALTDALHKETRLLLRHGQRLDHHKWRAKQQHRIVSLSTLLGADSSHDYQAGHLSLQLGSELRRLHLKANRLDPESSIAKCAATGTQRISRFAYDPAIAAVQACRTSKALARRGAHHLAECYQDLGWLLEQYASAVHPRVGALPARPSQG